MVGFTVESIDAAASALASAKAVDKNEFKPEHPATIARMIAFLSRKGAIARADASAVADGITKELMPLNHRTMSYFIVGYFVGSESSMCCNFKLISPTALFKASAVPDSFSQSLESVCVRDIISA